jgi:hypothetical protein
VWQFTRVQDSLSCRSCLIAARDVEVVLTAIVIEVVLTAIVIEVVLTAIVVL